MLTTRQPFVSARQRWPYGQSPKRAADRFAVVTRRIRRLVRLVLLAVAAVVFGVARFATARTLGPPPCTLTRYLDADCRPDRRGNRPPELEVGASSEPP